MDNSDFTAPKSPPPPVQEQGFVMLRALVSAAIFGTLGGALGKWLGKRSNPEGNRMAERIMKWGMGSFSAILAAYSSFKASEHVGYAEAQSLGPMLDAALANSAAENASVAADSKIPLSAVQAAAVETQGKIKETAPVQAMQK